MTTKIISLLLMLGSITLFVAWNASQRMAEADVAYSRLSDTLDVNTATLSRIHQRMTGMLYNSYMVIGYDRNSRGAVSAADQVRTDYRTAKEGLQELLRLEPGSSEAVVLAPVLEQLNDIVTQAIAHSNAGRAEAARQSLAEGDRIDRSFSPRLRAMIVKRQEYGVTLSAGLSARSATTSRNLYALAIAGVVGGIALAIFVMRAGVTGPLDRLQTRMREIAAGDYDRDVHGTDRGDEVGAMPRAVLVFRENGIAKRDADTAKARADAEQKIVVDTVSSHLSDLSAGDLTSAIDVPFPPEYATLKSNFNTALSSLRQLVGAVSESAMTIRTGSGEIAQASEDLARRTESNAASLEQTAASITQMDGRLKASATAAGRTVQRADQAIATVGGGRAVADQAVAAMGRVSDSAKGIDSVIEGLDKIAFQTRVLAMNAAVEAGRAGDAGRGFAVVADLVSALAMRAEEEAKRARDQLTVTQADIVTAVEAVTKVDGALSDISGDVGQVHELLATMAADNQAQSAAITQISAAIGTMDQSTQQNAAMVEETSAAARNLVGEVGNLADQAGRFKVEKAGRPATPARKPDYATPSAYAVLAPRATVTMATAGHDWKTM